VPGTESTIAIQVKRQTLQQPHDIPYAIAAPLEHFELGIQPFHKRTGLMVDEVVGNSIEPALQQLQEPIEAAQAALFDPSSPVPDVPQAIRFRTGRVDDRGELFAQGVGLLERRAMRQQRVQPLLLGQVQVSRPFTERPKRVFEICQRLLGQFGLEPLELVLAQAVDGVTVVPGHIKAVTHDPRVGEHLGKGGGVALPHIRTHCRDARSDGAGDGLQPGQHAGLDSIGQDRQHLHVPLLGLRTDQRDKVTVAFQEGNLIDAQAGERIERLPITGGRNGAVEDTEERVRPEIFLGFHIGERAIEQLDDQMALVGRGVQGALVIPVERLRGGGMAIAERAAEALGPDAHSRRGGPGRADGARAAPRPRRGAR